jgi:hypothetical protein
MKPQVIYLLAMLFLIGCTHAAGRYDIERYDFDLQFSKKYRDAGYELIDLVMKSTNDSGDRMYLILNKPIDESTMCLYDRQGSVFRKFEIGPAQLVQGKIHESEKSSYQYSILMDAVDVQLIYKVQIGEP